MFETTTEEAKDILSDYEEDIIGDIYDENEISDAILTLHPGFEYPDWSHKTVFDFLKIYGDI